MRSEKPILWFEVWIEGYAVPNYVLYLWENIDGTFEVYDPKEDHVCYKTDDLEDARFWLSEDEFTQVVGRVVGDDFTAPSLSDEDIIERGPRLG